MRANPSPIDTPPDWFARIAQREREWRNGRTSHAHATAKSLFGVRKG